MKKEKENIFSLFIPLKFDDSVISDNNPNVVVKENKSNILVKDKENKFDNFPQKNKAEEFPISNEEVNDNRYNIKENDKIILIMEDNIKFSKIILDFVELEIIKVLLLPKETG